MKQLGSFIEIEFDKGKEYYSSDILGEKNIIRLNTARSGIYHAVRCYGVKKVFLPLYQCDTVGTFLTSHGISVEHFSVDNSFTPIMDENPVDSAIVFSNYYGIFNSAFFESLISKFKNVIVDNAQSFFSSPLPNAISVYSARKFVGVPDGAYVIGENVNRFSDEYEVDYSSDTATFLLMRHEYGCSGVAYENRKKNEKRLDTSDIKLMSKLTQTILDGANYQNNIEKRKSNFQFARELFDGINEIRIENNWDDQCVPMVYPLLISQEGIIEAFHAQGIFQGHWWEYLVDKKNEGSFEYHLSKYIVPITIDQRCSSEDIIRQYEIIKGVIEK